MMPAAIQLSSRQIILDILICNIKMVIFDS